MFPKQENDLNYKPVSLLDTFANFKRKLLKIFNRKVKYDIRQGQYGF
jgi:hypothetical protein